MHRLQPFDASPASIAIADHASLLRRVFQRAVSCALASALGVGASGCYAAVDPQASPDLPGAGSGAAGQPARVTANPRPAGVSLHCVNGIPQLFTGLMARPFDAAEFRIQARSTIGPQIIFSQGVLCDTAADRAVCEAHVAAASDHANLSFTDTLSMYGPVARYVLTTRADEVSKYQSREELLQFLGPIDSPEDALLLLYYDKFPVTCPPANGIDPASIKELDDGYQVLFVIQTTSGCTETRTERVTLHVARDGRVTETARETTSTATTACAGRRPEGLRSQHLGAGAPALGEHFARMAHLEQASITAFEVLEAELVRHGAPEALIARARRAAAHEVRHTAMTRALALRFGARPTMAEVETVSLRSLEALAIDNAVEGCVRECFGAALGCYQARTAQDPEIAAAMAVIAEDETEHAALAFAIDGWVQSRLDDGARARVAAARARAVGELRGELAHVPDATTRAALGWPDATAALRVCSALEQSLWTA
jgi:hypothetical protein